MSETFQCPIAYTSRARGEKRLMERPETAAENMRQMIEGIFRPLMEMAAKAEAPQLGEIVEVEE